VKTKYLFLVVALGTLVILSACAPNSATPSMTTSGLPGVSPSAVFNTNPPVPGEVEATEFMGIPLTPIKEQNNNALAGTQHIDKSTYVLTVDGLVDNPLKLTYNDLLAFPQTSKLMPLDCVEGWNFTAKWTGPLLKDLFSQAKVQPGAKIAIFHTVDVAEGYSSLDVSYIVDKNILIALKLNDITLPDERGFPFQVAAELKYGYKWAKWITRIEFSVDTKFRGYWEGYGYNNNADIGGPAFESQ
jgi:DMSO/TMAO reductase YedYZ molybdopterin-dependent catalytic subunit